MGYDQYRVIKLVIKDISGMYIIKGTQCDGDDAPSGMIIWNILSLKVPPILCSTLISCRRQTERRR